MMKMKWLPIVAVIVAFIFISFLALGVMGYDKLANDLTGMPLYEVGSSDDYGIMTSGEVFVPESQDTLFVEPGTVVSCYVSDGYMASSVLNGGLEKPDYIKNDVAYNSEFGLNTRNACGKTGMKAMVGDIRIYSGPVGGSFYANQERYYALGSCTTYRPNEDSKVVNIGEDLECLEIVPYNGVQNIKYNVISPEVNIPVPRDDTIFEDSNGLGYNVISVDDICGYGEDLSYFQANGGIDNRERDSDGKLTGEGEVYLKGNCIKVKKITIKADSGVTNNEVMSLKNGQLINPWE